MEAQREGLGAGVSTIEAATIRSMPTPVADALRAVKTELGVTSNNELSNAYSVRGGSTNENQFFIDGFEVYRPIRTQQGEQEGLGLVNGDLVEAMTLYAGGFPVGYQDHKASYLFNHVNIIVEYHPLDDGSRVVGFYVEPFTVKHKFANDAKWDGSGEAPPLSTCDKSGPMVYEAIAAKQDVQTGPVIFTYDVLWRASNVKWASRWDVYLYATDEQIHWFSIVNSLMIVLFLSGMVAMIMTRTLHRDLRRYNDVESMEEMQEESGWKLVSHAPPPPPAIHVPCTAVARSSTCGARCRGARARGRSLPAPRMRRSTATSSARRRALGYSRCTSGRGRRSSRAR